MKRMSNVQWRRAAIVSAILFVTDEAFAVEHAAGRGVARLVAADLKLCAGRVHERVS